MKATKTSWIVVVGAGVIAGLFLVTITALTFWLPNWPGGLVKLIFAKPKTNPQTHK